MHRKILEFVVYLEDTSVVRMSFYVCGDAVSWKNCSNSRRFQIILPSVDLFQCINVPAKYLRNCSCELYTRLNFNLILLQLSRPFNFNVYCTERKKKTIKPKCLFMLFFPNTIKENWVDLFFCDFPKRESLVLLPRPARAFRRLQRYFSWLNTFPLSAHFWWTSNSKFCM